MKVVQQTETKIILQDEYAIFVPLVSILLGLGVAAPTAWGAVFAIRKLNLPAQPPQLLGLWILLLLASALLCAVALRIAITSLIDFMVAQRTTAQFDKATDLLSLNRWRFWGQRSEQRPLQEVRDLYLKLAGSWGLLSYRIILVFASGEEIPLGVGYDKEEQQQILKTMKQFLALRS
jgi:hypothetical protein